MGRLQNKVAMITGGAGGIGRATVEAFTAEGARVLVCDIDDAAGESAAVSARSLANTSGDASYYHCDITDESCVRGAVETALAKWGRLDILFNNAGGSTPADSPVTEMDSEEFWRVMRLDVFGTFLCSKYAIPAISESGSGSVINMTSVLALVAFRGRDCYTAAKGAIAALTRSMAVEYASEKIRVNAIAPGVTRTSRVEAMLEGEGGYGNLADGHLLGMVQPEHIAQMAVYLASDASQVVTGQVFPVDSGVSIH